MSFDQDWINADDPLPSKRTAAKRAKARAMSTLDPQSVPLHEMKALEAERDALRLELENERMRLVACGVVAQANTPESAVKAREMHADYHSASCNDVAAAVDREIALRLRVAALESEVVATRREVMPCNCAELPAERADADRLAAALRLVSDFDCTNGGWQSCGGRCPSCIAGETIAAHDARREHLHYPFGVAVKGCTVCSREAKDAEHDALRGKGTNERS